MLALLHPSVQRSFPGLLTQSSGATFNFLEEVFTSAAKNRGFKDVAERLNEKRHRQHMDEEADYLSFVRDMQQVPRRTVRACASFIRRSFARFALHCGLCARSRR